MEIVYNGLISERDSDYDQVLIDGDWLSNDADYFDGLNVSVKYWISDNPIDGDKVIENELLSIYKGKADVSGYYLQGSEWTGIYGVRDSFMVGGHNLVRELESHIGKYCYLIIKTID